MMTLFYGPTFDDLGFSIHRADFELVSYRIDEGKILNAAVL